MRREANFEQSVAGVRALAAGGAADDEIAAWLKDRTADFGRSVSVYALAHGLERREAGDRLRSTATWQDTMTRFRIVEPGGVYHGEFQSINGRTYSVGDVLKLPGGPCQVAAVGQADDSELTAELLVEWVERAPQLRAPVRGPVDKGAEGAHM